MGSKGQMTVTPDLPPEFEDLLGDTSTSIGGFQGRLPLMGNQFTEAETDWGYPEWRDNPRLPGGHGLGRTDPSIVSTDRGAPPETTPPPGEEPPVIPPVGLPGKPMPGAGGLQPTAGTGGTGDEIAPAKAAGPQSLGLGVGEAGGGGRQVAYIDEQGRPRSEGGWLVNSREGDQVAPAQRDFTRQEGWGQDWWSEMGLEPGKYYDRDTGGNIREMSEMYPDDPRYTQYAGSPVAGYAGPYVTGNVGGAPDWALLEAGSHTDPRMKFPGYGGRNPGADGSSSRADAAAGAGDVQTTAKAATATTGDGTGFGGSDFWSGASPVIQQIYDLFYPKQDVSFDEEPPGDDTDGGGGGGGGTGDDGGGGGGGDPGGGTGTFKPITDTGGNMGMAMNPDPSAGMGFAAPWIRPVSGTAPIFDWAADQIPGMAAPSGYMNAAGAATGAGVDASKRKVLGAGLPQPPRSTFGAGGADAKSRIAPLPTGTTSPTFEASRRAFDAMTMPMIQQNRTLMGLGRSNAVGKDTADAWAGMLPSLIEGELGREERGIEREMGGAFQAANLYGGLENQLFGRETGATDRGMAAGQLYRGVAEDLNKAIYEDFTRRQGMSEKLLYAPFGQAQSAVGQTSQQGGLFK